MNQRSDGPRGKENTRLLGGTLALAFVILTLVVLVVVPLLVQSRVNELRTAIQYAEPARSLVHRLQYNLSRERGVLAEIIITGDTTSNSAFITAHAWEDSLYATLDEIVDVVGPEAREHFDRSRALTDEWHERIRDERILSGRGDAPANLLSPEERRLFEEILIATSAIDEAILARAEEAREQIFATERMGLRVTLMLSVLALLAAAAAQQLHSRIRDLAAEAERRRQLAEEALEESARATEARVRLLRGVTHDVKNPLGAAKGYAELLEMGVKAPLAPEQEPLVRGLRRSIDGALGIISDLLHVARADSGGLVIERVEVDLREVAGEAVEDRRPAAEATGHSLRFRPAAEPVSVHTDPTRVRQILDNLLSNAIKYTPAPGRITVSTELSRGPGTPRPGDWAAVRVSDTGPGIEPERREAIFEEFTRFDDGHGQEGHGLGLAIGRSLARLLGGDITLEESGPGGSTFVLWLPRRETDEGGEGDR